ncbi:MAG: gliding motility-associated C-terminal domain-containing protein, partial [Bacteroidota bacterium]|nr:gliding motility-associated C-terminal domain-containing protein [Bacteroidota bacterium]
NTVCSHIRQQPYSAIFRAEDINPEVNLTAYTENQIQVVAPSPENLNISPSSNASFLSWAPYGCNNAAGFIIYRRHGSYSFTPSECETGMPDYAGYTMVDTLKDIGAVSYIDTDLPPGYEYCYRITAYYDDGSESYVSEEICAELERGTPAFVNADILNTDPSTGSVFLKWIQPTEFDDTEFPGPYKYELEASPGLYGENYAKIADIPGIADTTYTETNTDTKTRGRSYKLTLFSQDGSNWAKVGAPAYTSTVFIEGLPDDRKMTLLSNENTPWTNYDYTVYRKDADEDCTPNVLSYDSVGTSNNNRFTDYNLNNDLYYWYKVRTTGGYDLNYLPDTTINFSQEICVSPQDTIAPCAVDLTVDSDCDLEQNYLSWEIIDSCAYDTESYNIYYTGEYEGELELIATVNGKENTTYTHKPEGAMGACYAVAAIDSAGNVLTPAQLKRTCIDICHNYELPNVFTPDGDGINDLFIPFPYNYVEKIDIKIYTRWGSLVFESENPDINWDGTNMNTNTAVTDGVYYYICDVYEKRLTGIEVRNINGFIHIFANKSKSKKP